MSHFPFHLLPIIGCLIALGIQAMAQTPTVQLTNLTRGGSNFIVGDDWRVDITGPPSQEVKVTATQNGNPLGTTSYGYTDGSGQFQLSGFMDAGAIGNWSQVWSVGDVPAVPTLNFSVTQPPPGCEAYAVPVPPVMFSTDVYYYPYFTFPDVIHPGFALVGGQITSANCAFVFTSFEPLGWPPMISASLSLVSPLTVVWDAWDNQNLGAYGFAHRCLNCFYPVIQSAAFTFIAVDVYSNVYVLNTGLGLWIDQQLL